MTSSPNIIFIIADDHRARSLGVHGCSEVSTPQLDALAASGADFTNAHCQGGFNPAVCVPSRASFLSGRSVFDLTPEDERDCNDFSAGACIPASMPTVPERLREAGYQTHAVGKWHNDKESFARAFTSAEHILFGGMSEHEHMMLQDFDPQGCYEEGRATHVPGHSTDLFREAAVAFMRDRQSTDPFFLYVAFTAPHDPRTPPTAFVVDPDTVSLPVAYAPVHPFDTGETLIRDEQLEAFPRSESAIRQHVADYYGMITHLDDAVGAIVSEVRRQGLQDNTVIVYTADHGLGLGNHGLMGKQNLYEHSTGIPLIVSGSSFPAGTSSDVLVWHGDTHATVLGLAGLEPQPECNGEDLLPLLFNDPECRLREYFGSAYRSSQRAIRDERYKLIRYYKSDDASSGNNTSPTAGASLEQLFDLKEDPEELVNLIFLPEYESIRRRLQAALSVWQTEHGDSLVA